MAPPRPPDAWEHSNVDAANARSGAQPAVGGRVLPPALGCVAPRGRWQSVRCQVALLARRVSRQGQCACAWDACIQRHARYRHAGPHCQRYLLRVAGPPRCDSGRRCWSDLRASTPRPGGLRSWASCMQQVDGSGTVAGDFHQPATRAGCAARCLPTSCEQCQECWQVGHSRRGRRGKGRGGGCHCPAGRRRRVGRGHRGRPTSRTAGCGQVAAPSSHTAHAGGNGCARSAAAGSSACSGSTPHSSSTTSHSSTPK
mmetsp:Transcript_56082/g.114187  ORF Transcript_56082/g.114187 Transcript_56082/m.114187 type:complete len:256 (+) Transcript_56082:2283-3050(+)